MNRPSGRWQWMSHCLLLVCSMNVVFGCQAMRLGAPLNGKIEHPDRDAVAQGPTPPGKYRLPVSQFVFLSDFELQRRLPLFQELRTLREQVYKELQLPSSTTTITVYLFEDRDHYDTFMHARYPDLPPRRAFFVAQPRVGGTEDLLVYTYWGDRIQEDLRHELTHALLHSVLKDVPLWLDEGLAEYFEVPPQYNGINPHHLELLCRNSAAAFKPDLARLEQLTEVQQMTPVEYREAWAWVHLMLRDKPSGKVVLCGYLQQLRTTTNPGLLGPRLATVYAVPNDAFTAHLAQLDAVRLSQRAQGS